MAVMKKQYALPPVYLSNAVCDVAEIRKAKLAYPSKDEIHMETEMYGDKRKYLIRIAQNGDGTRLMIETDGDSENIRQDITLMFTILDGIILNALRPQPK